MMSTYDVDLTSADHDLVVPNGAVSSNSVVVASGVLNCFDDGRSRVRALRVGDGHARSVGG